MLFNNAQLLIVGTIIETGEGRSREPFAKVHYRLFLGERRADNSFPVFFYAREISRRDCRCWQQSSHARTRYALYNSTRRLLLQCQLKIPLSKCKMERSLPHQIVLSSGQCKHHKSLLFRSFIRHTITPLPRKTLLMMLLCLSASVTQLPFSLPRILISKLQRPKI